MRPTGGDSRRLAKRGELVCHLEEGIDAQGGIERLARQSCPLHLPAAIASGASSAAAWASTEETILQRCFLMYPHARQGENNACMICFRLKW